jgi:hypothetical protein
VLGKMTTVADVVDEKATTVVVVFDGRVTVAYCLLL